jgi:septal ring factor EnvC (AmiA/AmiB activator)
MWEIRTIDFFTRTELQKREKKEKERRRERKKKTKKRKEEKKEGRKKEKERQKDHQTCKIFFNSNILMSSPTFYLLKMKLKWMVEFSTFESYKAE